MSSAQEATPRSLRRRPEESALERYRTLRGEPDVELELPERRNSVAAASLIGADAIARGRSVVYVTSDELVDQIVKQIAALPEPAAVNLHRGMNQLRDLVAHHNAQALGVLGFSTYFSANPRIDPADVVLLDTDRIGDGVIGSLFMVRVDRRLQPQAYEKLRELIGESATPRVLEADGWAPVAARVGELLTGLFCGESTQFVWLRLQPFLGDCQVVVGPDDIEIRPPHELLHSLPGYRHAGQRVHLSTAPVEVAAADVDTAELDLAGLSPSVRYAMDYLRTCFTDPDLTLNRVASAVYMSRYHFSRSFREQTGWRFIDFVTMLRMNEARFLLRETSTSITDVARAVGYRELSHFQRMFKKRFGMSASSYRAGAGAARERDLQVV
ncbi:helix-turn-helix transcriptional regulator [Saccharopolyspora sp. NPDC000995]